MDISLHWSSYRTTSNILSCITKVFSGWEHKMKLNPKHKQDRWWVLFAYPPWGRNRGVSHWRLQPKYGLSCAAGAMGCEEVWVGHTGVHYHNYILCPAKRQKSRLRRKQYNYHIMLSRILHGSAPLYLGFPVTNSRLSCDSLQIVQENVMIIQIKLARE